MNEYPEGPEGRGAEIAELRERLVALERRAAPRPGESPSEGILRDMLTALPLAVYELDTEGTIVFTNAAYAAVTGYGADELLGMKVHELMAPGPARDATPGLLARLAREMPPPTPIIAENQRPDGQRVHVEVHWNYRSDANGRAIGFVCVLQDITDRIRAVQDLRVSEERFRRVFDQSPWGTVVYEPSGRPLYVNSVHLAVMGFTDDDVALARAHYNILEDQQLAGLGLRPLIEKGFAGEPMALPDTLYDPRSMHPPLDKDPRWVRGYVYPVKDTQGEVREVVVTFEDVTKERQAEELRAALEARLQHAQKLESLSVLAGGIAHDFNNLLVAILGNADLALMDLAEDSPVRGSIADIVGGASRAADLVRQLLAYSGRSQVAKGLVDVSRLVNEVGHLVEAAISKKAVLRRDLAPSVPPVEADATQLRQIVMNLMINASESLDGGSGSISVRTGVKECDAHYLAQSYVDDELPAGRYCFIEVEDTGAGMAPETLERLFEPFFTTKFTGRGLGLAAVLGIVRGHRGAVYVRSELGEGSSFEVLLPIAQGRAYARREGVATEGWRGQGTLLVVDDEEAVRAVAERMVRRLGFDVVTACDGHEAVDHVRRDPTRFVGVLLDLSMPRMDGAECLRELREIRQDLPVLISSGFGKSELAGRFGDTHPTGFVQKPYKLTVLSDHLRAALS